MIRSPLESNLDMQVLRDVAIFSRAEELSCRALASDCGKAEIP